MGCTLSLYEGSENYGEIEVKRLMETSNTGDILLFSSSSPTSCVIRCSTSSPWSHVGMIVRTKTHPKTRATMEKERLYVWHSTKEELLCKDILSSAFKRGVQLNSLQQIMMEYGNSVIYVRRVGGKVISDRNDLFRKHYEFFKEWGKKDYERDTFELVNSALDLPFDRFKNADSYYSMQTVFCSELLAYTYIQFKWNGKNGSCNEYTPANFSSGDLHQFNFKEGIVLGTEKLILRD